MLTCYLICILNGRRITDSFSELLLDGNDGRHGVAVVVEEVDNDLHGFA